MSFATLLPFAEACISMAFERVASGRPAYCDSTSGTNINAPHLQNPEVNWRQRPCAGFSEMERASGTGQSEYRHPSHGFGSLQSPMVKSTF